jgi:hypothetical protein
MVRLHGSVHMVLCCHANTCMTDVVRMYIERVHPASASIIHAVLVLLGLDAAAGIQS